MNSDDAQARKQARKILSPFQTPAAKAHFARIGAKGGASTSETKAETARRNGAKGGRPPGKAK